MLKYIVCEFVAVSTAISVPKGGIVRLVLFPGVWECLEKKRYEVQICKALLRPVADKKCGIRK